MVLFVCVMALAACGAEASSSDNGGSGGAAGSADAGAGGWRDSGADAGANFDAWVDAPRPFEDAASTCLPEFCDGGIE